MEKIQNYINGRWVPPQAGNYLDNYNPAEGKVYSLIPDSDEKDIGAAVQSAQNAFPIWSRMAVSERSNFMIKIADLIARDKEMLAQAESIDNGKPISLAREVDIPRAEANFRFFATAILHFSSEAHLTDDVAVNYTRRSPIGVAGCISPWNLPLYLFTWKIAPALAAGNCVVAKPSEITPMTAYLLSKIADEAGLPVGVLNIVHGLGAKAGAAIVAHPEVPVITFTGGTVTGKKIASVAAPIFKKLSLELGGKNPNIIFDDCDFEIALETTVRSSFSNQGQICLCGSRIFIQEGIYEKFKKALVEKVEQLIIGDPMEETTQFGALVSQAHLNKVLSYIDLAKEEGGKILTGGKQVYSEGRCSDGYFLQPTIIEGLENSCRTNQEEIFGPVITLMPFKDEDEVITLANQILYGLSATIWTENNKRAHKVAHALKAGVVWVNCWLLRDLRTPFGGMKASGVGREGGLEALRFFTEVQNVCVKL
ncbi:MAG: aldehyde dehydrogenase [Cyclobacteriaceae bacterium]|nr:aldehyde dehydrogenase [Cyclobacteriaceae bacterium]